MRPFRVRVPCRHDTEHVKELLQRIFGHGKLKQEHDGVGENEQPRRDSRISGRNRILYRKHISLPPTGKLSFRGHRPPIPFTSNWTARCTPFTKACVSSSRGAHLFRCGRSLWLERKFVGAAIVVNQHSLSVADSSFQKQATELRFNV